MSRLRTIFIDDSGWGFPLGGVLCGAYDSETKRFIYKEIEVRYFQEVFKTKQYLRVFGERALEIVQELEATPENAQIKICRGFVNNKAAEFLKSRGFKIQRGVIKEPLQSALEAYHKEYVQRLGYGKYYDPKDIAKEQIPKEFYAAIRWAEKNQRNDLLKSGWKFFMRRKRV